MAATRRPGGLRPVTLVLLAVTVASSVPVGVLAAVLPRPVIPPPPPLAITAVTVVPTHPVPDQFVTVTAHLSRPGSSPFLTLAFASAFGSNISGTPSMTRVDDRTYQAMIFGLPGGTEVWYVVVAYQAGLAPIHSDPATFVVGTVPRGGLSALAIADVLRSPAQPAPFADATFSATVTTDRAPPVPVVQYFEIERAIVLVGTIDMMSSGTTFSVSFFCLPDTDVFWRIVAYDGSGNTAVSAAALFHIPESGP